MIEDPNMWWEVCERIYQQWGYLVFGSAGPHQLGDIFDTAFIYSEPTCKLPQPFRIIAATTRDDYLAQAAAAGADIRPERVLQDAYFYRAITE